MRATCVRSVLLTVSLCTALGSAPPVDAQGAAQIRVRARENGAPASCSVRVAADPSIHGRCDTPMAVPSGDVEVIVELDGAIDRPTQTQRVTVRAGSSADVVADFATASIQIDVTSGGRRAAAMAQLVRSGVQVATLASGVAAHVSAGTYDVVIRQRGAEQRFDGVTLVAGERRTISATF